MKSTDSSIGCHEDMIKRYQTNAEDDRGIRINFQATRGSIFAGAGKKSNQVGGEKARKTLGATMKRLKCRDIFRSGSQ